MTQSKMSRIDYVRSETDLFTEPGYDLSINSTTTTEHHPISSITQTSPIEFFLQGNDMQYVDLSKTKLKLRFKIVDADGTDMEAVPLTATINYAPVNYLLASAFDRVTVHLNEVEVTPKSSLYPYQAYLETLLSYGSEFKKGQAEAAGFFRVQDEGVQTDDGWKARKKLCDASKEFEFMGKPHGEVFNQTRYLMPGVDVRITFYRTPSSFNLERYGTSDKKVQLQILEAKLFVQKVSLLPSIHMGHLRLWKSTPCVYPGKRVVMKNYSLPSGTYQHTNENLLNGLIPDRIIVGLVATTNFQGAYDKNPFKFEDFKLSEIVITCNAESTTQRVIKMDKSNSRVLEGFTSLFDAMGISNCDSGLDLKVAEYNKGKTLFGWDIRNLSDGFSLPRHGNCSIFLKFKESLTESVTVIVYPEYPSTMYISNDKQVYFKDYTKEY